MAEKITTPTLPTELQAAENTAAPLAVPVETVPLNVVLASIVRDSRAAAKNFLDQVHVPHGGE
jgi:hypothetical protein